MGTTLFGVAATWWSFAATARQVLEPVQPSLVFLGMVNAQAQAVAASNLVVRGASQGQWNRARKLAMAALDREPGNVVAARTMAFLAGLQGQPTAYNTWLRYGESLSRRDTITQFALIENNVAAGDVLGALRHYNRAMLVNVSSRDTLLTVLIPAVSNMLVARALVPFLQRRPAWWPHFVGALNGGGTNPATIQLVLHSLLLDMNNESEAEALGAGLERMIALGDPDGAFAFYRNIRKPAPGLIRDGSFEQARAFGPFEWTIADDGSSSASRQERTDGRGLALFVTAGDTDGIVAHQFSLLAAGNYVLAARMVPDSTSAPAMSIRVQCAKTGAELVKMTSSTPEAAHGIQNASFRVPEGCALTKIVIGVDAASAGQAAGWIDDVAVTRL